MAQGSALGTIPSVPQATYIADSSNPNLDAFSRLRVSNPETLYSAQMTYDLQPLLVQAVTSSANAVIGWSQTEHWASMSFNSAAANEWCALQTYDWLRYQPGKSQMALITFNMSGTQVGADKFVRYGDFSGSNSIGLETSGSFVNMALRSTTSHGVEIVSQSQWNLDKLDGSGSSGLTLDLMKSHIFFVDFQALYVGRVRTGLDIDGMLIYTHEFTHANIDVVPYIANANLPICVGMRSTEANVTAGMYSICNAVVSEGGLDPTGYTFTADGSVTAASGARTHMLSIRPKTTFKGQTNRTKIVLESLDVLVTGNSPIHWELCIGDTLTGAAWTDASTNYSAVEYDTTATTGASPTIVVDCGYVAATAATKGTIRSSTSAKYPLTLDAYGNNRSLGTLTLLVTGLGGTSACRASLVWREIR